jgi:glutaredoxin
VLNRDYTDRTLRSVTKATSYPQVFVDGSHVGGSDDLERWLRDSGKLTSRDAA